MKCGKPEIICVCHVRGSECQFGGPCPHQVPDAPPSDPVFNCPPFCTKCGRFHDIGPCPPQAIDPTPGDCDTCEYDDGRCIKTVLECKGYKLRVEPTSDPATENKSAAPRAIGQHWLEVAAERVRVGEDEATVMRDYGYYTDYMTANNR